MIVAPNFIVVEDILPYIPKDQTEKLKEVVWSDTTFTTFSLCGTGLLEYEITSDGAIYVTEEDGGIEKLDYTGEIEFNTLVLLENKDCEVAFKALFYKGELKNLSLEDLKETDPAPRLEAQEKLMQVIESREDKQKKWWFKIYSFYSKCVIFVFTLIRWILGGIIKLCWIIQNKIT